MADTPSSTIYTEKVPISFDTQHTASLVSATIVNSKQKPLIIWTPRFIVTFALTLVLSLSLTSILAEIWNNTGHSYSADHVTLTYSVATLGCWLIVLLRTHSPWIRGSASFCIIWTLLKAGTAIFNLLGLSDHLIVSLHLTAATSSALLGACLCLSIARTPSSQWDNWFLRLAPLLIVAITAWLYLQESVHGWFAVEHALNSALLCLSLFLWWLRPSCWKFQHGPTFLLGAIPLMQLIIDATHDTASPTTQYFFGLIMLLSMLFGGMRILQGERVASDRT